MATSVDFFFAPSLTKVMFLQFGAFPPTVVTHWRGTTTIQFTQDPAYYFSMKELIKKMGFTTIIDDTPVRTLTKSSKIRAFCSTLVDKVHSDEVDDEFIKVEELLDIKESCHLFKPIVDVTEDARNLESTNSVSNILLLMEEKIQELEFQLKTSIEDLKHSESEKVSLKTEVDIANEKLELMNRHCEELELNHKIMKDKILEAEEKNNLQLRMLQEALAAKDTKNMEILDIKGAYTCMSAELEMSSRKLEEFEAALFSSSMKVHLLEQLNKQNSSQAELESARALEIEKMMELAQTSQKEMECQLGELQNELEVLYDKIAEDHYIEEKLEISKAEVAALEQKIIYQDSIIHGLTEELKAHNAFEEKTRAKVDELENLISASTEDLKARLVCLEEVEWKLDEQVKEWEIVEDRVRNQEIQTLNLEKDLKASTAREKEPLEKLRYADEQLGQLENAIDELSARNLEVESVHEIFVKDLELKLQETEDIFERKVSEARELQEKVKSLEEHMAYFKDQAVQANDKVSLLKAELEGNTKKLVSLESYVEELKQKASDSYLKNEQIFSAKELLFGTNSRLREELQSHQLKVNELNELLNSINAEKKVTSQQMSSHVERIAKLADECSKVSELQSVTESYFKETEVELQEVIEKLMIRDSENKNLKERLLTLEAQLLTCEKGASKLAEVAENQDKSEDALSKFWDLKGLFEQLLSRFNQFKMQNEDLARQNLNLINDLATYVTKINEMQITLSAILAEKEDTSLKHHSSRGEMVNLEQKLISDKERLQSQIKIMRSAAAKMEAAVTDKLKEQMCIFRERNNLNQQLKQIQNECDLARTIIIEQVMDGTIEAKIKGTGKLKSRDLRLDNSTLSKRKSKKVSNDLHQAPQITSHQTAHAVVEPLEILALKFILCVAIMSLIIGIVLGKSY
ncbi:hypothetical protein Cni_G12090 [Canna indica]|uniref:Uncharacterized protein n=1 Tax=Canna indica TaxID=4628 RepID=A0AAQ3K7I6_9LILI|nr:hypothetical protein Cni_G12090 [Canna indica]